MRFSVVVRVLLAWLLSSFISTTAYAQETGETSGETASAQDAGETSDETEYAQDDGETSDEEDEGLTYGSLDDPEDPQNLLLQTKERRAELDSLFRASPLRGVHKSVDDAQQRLYDSTGLNLGLSFTHVFQGLSEAFPDADRWGTATTTNFFGTWELVSRGKKNQGQLFFLGQGRWDYGTTGPEQLGTFGLGSLVGTANTFSAYTPTFLLRNLYWQQGSKQAGWVYRVGKISPDATLSTSAHIASPTTFLTTAGTGPFSNALPDSGLGAVANWYINDRVSLLGLVSDANGNRFNWGDLDEGDLYTAVELAAKIAPRTPKAGYSKLTAWHTDGTKDGAPSNGQAGPDGWGYFLKHEQELTADGRAIGVLRYGRSFNDSAFYEQQGGASFLLYNPTGPGRLKNDLVGIALNQAISTVPGAANEYNAEVFYRFPIVPLVDMTLSYQAVIHPALDPDNDFASVFSIRFRTTF